MYKIYRILDNTNGDVYIGQTRQKLTLRINNHVADSNRDRYCVSKHIIRNGDYTVDILEQTDDKSRERYWIENTECINKVIPGRTVKEHYQDTKHLIDRTERSEYHKKYRSESGCDRIKYRWYSSMGGNPYKINNSLLRIDTELFYY